MSRGAGRGAGRAAGALAVALLAAGCGHAVAVAPAPQAADPRCAQVYAALPDAVAGLERRETTAQGAAAWTGPAADGGEPSTVVLRCGVEPPGPGPDCQQVEGAGASVDWVYGPSRDGRVTWTTYGREPAVALEVPDDPDVTSAATLDVGAAVALVPQQRTCD